MLPDKGTRLVEEQLPPYVSYQQWKRLLDNLAIFMPSRFDASYFEDLGLSATNRSMLKGTLRFLGLMAPDGTPTPRLRELINSNAETQPKTLEATLRRAYAPLFLHLDLAHASRGQVKDYFKKEGIEGDIGRKCWSFFRRVAADAGIELSPPLDWANSGKRREKAGLQDPPPPRTPRTVQAVIETIWPKELLQKFPSLDLQWPDDLKKKWFDDFRELARLRPFRRRTA